MPADLNQLDQQDPMMDPEASPDMGDTGQTSGEVPGLEPGETDREGAMAKADLFKLANYSHKLFGQLQDDQQLEAWVQAKITKAADYIASVYHYLEYEMKFSEYGHHLDNSDTLSEGQKMQLKEMLAEAKDKMKELKKSQAEKMKEKKVEEGMIGGGHKPCMHCGGTGTMYEEPKPVPSHVQAKIDKHKKLTNFIDKKIKDANHNGIPDNEETVDEELRVGDSYKTKRGGTVTKTKTGTTHIKGDYDDEPYHEPAKKPSKAGMTGAERQAQKSQDKDQEDASKAWEKKYPGTVTRHSISDKSRNEKADKDFAKDDKADESMYEAKKKGDGNLANNAKPYGKVTRGDVIAGRLGKDEMGGKKKIKESAHAMAELAHHHACEYAGHHKMGNLEHAMHHKEKCEECGGMLTHGPMGECYHTHPHLNNGQMYECGMGNMVYEEKQMTRAAKGVMKYGKDGMKALAKAGKDGKDLDKVRDKYNKYDESAKWRDPKYKDRFYTQEPDDSDDYDSIDYGYDTPERPENDPGQKRRMGGVGSEFDHNDPLKKGYGRYGVGLLNTHGKRKGLPSRDHITSLKGSIKDAHGKHTHPNLPESKPSAGLSKEKKSAVVKKAKAGGDIGKPGKSFKDVAKKAGGGEKGEKIAAAAMWKNMKETVAYMAEKKAAAKKNLPGNQEKIDVNHNGKIDGDDLAKLRAGKKETVKESTDFTRMQDQLTRLNRNESHILKESSEVDQIRALTKKLLG